MSILIMLIATLIFVVAATALSGGLPVDTGPVGLVFPLPGAPLSAQQVEERTRSLPDGTSSAETTMVSQIYRDSAGRMRIEWRIPNSGGGPVAIVDLIDPVARSIILLLVDSKIASVSPHSGSGPFQVGFPAVGEWPAGRKWQTKTEGLGRRVIEGVEVEGARTVQTSEDQPPLIAVQEKWWSSSLGLTLAVEAWGPNWKHTAKLRNLERREPDPALFVIPADYTIQDR